MVKKNQLGSVSELEYKNFISNFLSQKKRTRFQIVKILRYQKISKHCLLNTY